MKINVDFEDENTSQYLYVVITHKITGEVDTEIYECVSVDTSVNENTLYLQAKLKEKTECPVEV